MSTVKLSQSGRDIELNMSNIHIDYSKALYNLIYALNEAGNDDALEASLIAALEIAHPGIGADLGKEIQADFYALRKTLDEQARQEAIARLDVEAAAEASAAAGSVTIAQSLPAVKPFAAAAEGTVVLDSSAVLGTNGAMYSSAVPGTNGAMYGSLGLKAPGTFASGNLELVGFSDAASASASAAEPAPSAHVLTLEDKMRALGNAELTVLSSGDVAPDAAAFLASHKMSVAVFPAPADGGVTTLTGEAIPEGE